MGIRCAPPALGVRLPTGAGMRSLKGSNAQVHQDRAAVYAARGVRAAAVEQDRARYGGGLWMRLQHRTIPCAIDLSACGLDQIEESDDAFVIGAMTPLSVLESHADFARATNGVFTAAVRDIVGPQFCNLATVGGSLYGRFGFSDVLGALLALECEVKFTGAGRMSLADLCEEGYPRDVLERVVVHRRPYQASYKCLRRQAADFPVVNVAAAYWGDEWHVAVGARPCRALADRLPAGL